MQEQLRQKLITILESLGLSKHDANHLAVLKKTPTNQYGDITFDTRRVARLLQRNPEEVAQQIVNLIQNRGK